MRGSYLGWRFGSIYGGWLPPSHDFVLEKPSLPFHPTLPLSGRQGVWGGKAESIWWPVHSRGLLGALGELTPNSSR